MNGIEIKLENLDKGNTKGVQKGIQKEYNGTRLYKRNQNLTFVMVLNNITLISELR